MAIFCSLKAAICTIFHHEVHQKKDEEALEQALIVFAESIEAFCLLNPSILRL